MIAQLSAMCLTLALLGGQVYGLLLLSERMTASRTNGDPQAASIALVRGRYCLPGTALLILAQLTLLFAPRGLERQVRRCLAPLFFSLLLTEIVWLVWALRDFGIDRVTYLEGAAVLMGLIAPVVSGIWSMGLLRRQPSASPERRFVMLLVILCAVTWLWFQASWFAVALEA